MRILPILRIDNYFPDKVIAAFPNKMTKLCAAHFIELRLFSTDGEADLLPEKRTITLTEKMNSAF